LILGVFFRIKYPMTRTIATLTLVLLTAAAACSSVIPNTDAASLTPKPFPAVRGTTLSGQALEIPKDLLGKPAILLVGYEMNAQFDGDRWLVGLTQLDTPTRVVELPTIDGMIPGLFAGAIDRGMRSGIPSEDWPSVATVYGEDAATLVKLTGNTIPRNMRVFLLDAEGRIVWFHDRGFSASILKDLDARARALAP
jgi:hypothetical protein